MPAISKPGLARESCVKDDAARRLVYGLPGGELMAGSFSLRASLRTLSADLLAEYLQSLGAVPPDQLPASFEWAIQRLPDHARFKVEADLRDVQFLGCEGGVLAVMERAVADGLDLSGPLGRLTTSSDKVFWVLIHHREYFDQAYEQMITGKCRVRRAKCVFKEPPRRKRSGRALRILLSYQPEDGQLEFRSLLDSPELRATDDPGEPRAERAAKPGGAAGLTAAERDVLEALAEKAGTAASVADLMAAAGYGKATVRKALDRLRELGLAAKPAGTSRKGDVITPEGREHLGRDARRAS